MQLYLENTGLNKNVKGYAGPIDIGMTVGMDGRIRSVRHLRSMETTSYLRDIEKAGFYTQFEGIPLDGKSYEVDFVSGASLTSEGIARSVSKLVSIARESPLEAYVDTQATGFDVKAVRRPTWMLHAGLIAALFAGGSVQESASVEKPEPRPCGVLSILYLGFYANNSFTYVTFLQPFLGTGWSYLLGAYAAMVLARRHLGWQFLLSPRLPLRQCPAAADAHHAVPGQVAGVESRTRRRPLAHYDCAVHRDRSPACGTGPAMSCSLTCSASRSWTQCGSGYRWPWC